METELPPLPQVLWWDRISRDDEPAIKGWVYFGDHTRLAVNTAADPPIFPDFQDLWHPDRITKRHYRQAIRKLGFGESIVVLDPEEEAPCSARNSSG